MARTPRNNPLPVARRAVLLGAGALALAPSSALAAFRPGWPRKTRFKGFNERYLAMRQVGRDEAGHVRFRKPDGRIDIKGVNTLSWLFRDWRDDDMGLGMSVRLFDKLATIQTLLTAVEDRRVPLILHSGYRTPERNATLEGAAVHSQHIVGRAADISAEGIEHARVAQAAEIAGAHGLGQYDIFTHVDVGPLGRRWSRLS